MARVRMSEVADHYLPLTEGNRLVGVHGQPHLRQVLPHGSGVVPGMSDVGAGGKERETETLSPRRRSQPREAPCLLTGPSPLDPRSSLPTSIAVQTLSVDVVTELLPPSLPLGLGHRADCRTSSSNSEPHAQSRVLAGSEPQCTQGFSGNVVL